MIRIAIIIGSTRPGRKGEAVANGFTKSRKSVATPSLNSWISRLQPAASRRADVAMFGQYTKEHTRVWAAKIAVLRRVRLCDTRVQPRHLRRAQERNRFLYNEWNNKAAGFVGYGGAGGARAVEQLRLVLARGANRRRCATKSCSPCLPTSKTSASSSRLPSTRSLSMPCLTRSSPGAALEAAARETKIECRLRRSVDRSHHYRRIQRNEKKSSSDSSSGCF